MENGNGCPSFESTKKGPVNSVSIHRNLASLVWNDQMFRRGAVSKPLIKSLEIAQFYESLGRSCGQKNIKKTYKDWLEKRF